MFTTRTEYVNINGTPKVRARQGGKQRTMLWDLSQSTDWNHGAAAGLLIREKFPEQIPVWLGTPGHHDSNDSGTKHGFEV